MALNKQSQLDFAQQLLTLFNAGLALLNAIELIQSSAPKDWQHWLRDVQAHLKKGNSFSLSLMAQHNLFSMEFINLIRVSERTGDIELALKTICQQLEAQI
jgi:type IV pilus assembly protein PilC